MESPVRICPGAVVYGPPGHQIPMSGIWHVFIFVFRGGWDANTVIRASLPTAVRAVMFFPVILGTER